MSIKRYKIEFRGLRAEVFPLDVKGLDSELSEEVTLDVHVEARSPEIALLEAKNALENLLEAEIRGKVARNIEKYPY